MDKLKYEPVIDANGRKRGLKVLITCPVCEQTRWVRIDATRLKSFSGMCKKCHNKFTSPSGEAHPMWKGGMQSHGYKEVKIYPGDFLYPMARKSGYLREHRAVMARSLGRLLKTSEVVHHKNGIRNDNRIENLELISRSVDHLPSMMDAGEIERLKKKNIKLQNIITDLQKQIADLKEKIKYKTRKANGNY